MLTARRLFLAVVVGCLAAAGAARTEEPAQEPWKQEIRKSLAKKVTFEFVDVPLPEAVAFIRQTNNIPVMVDPRLAAEGAQVTLHAKDMELGSALKWVCRLANADYDLRDQALFIFSTKEAEQQKKAAEQVVRVEAAPPPGPPRPEALGRVRVRSADGTELDADHVALDQPPPVVQEFLDRALDHPKDGLLVYRHAPEAARLDALLALLKTVAPKVKCVHDAGTGLLLVTGDDAAELRRAEAVLRAVLLRSAPPAPVQTTIFQRATQLGPNEELTPTGLVRTIRPPNRQPVEDTARRVVPRDDAVIFNPAAPPPPKPAKPGEKGGREPEF